MAGGNHKVEIIVGLKDLASDKLNSIKNNMSNLGKGLSNNFSGIGRHLDTSIKKLDKMANSMYKFNMYTADIQRNLRNIGTIGGLAVGGLAYSGAKSALDFDYKSHIMQSRMEVPDNIRKQIEDYVLKDLNLQVGFDPNQIMDMGIVLGQAGISNAPDMKAMMKSTAYFSEAVDAVPEEAAEMIVAAAKGFNISMENSSQITDKLTVALNKSLLHVEEMPHAIGQLAGRANMYGQSMDSSLVALMSMRDQGMSAAQGSQDLLHALRQASRIGNNSVLYAKTRGYFEELGVTDGIFNKDTRKLKEFPELIADMEKVMVKQGFTNNKYGIKNMDDYYKFLDKNGGKAPEDFWDSMKVAPLITKVFGAAGQAPILMGLQTKYEEVNDKGEKTGEVLYGSEALKKMYNEVKNSDGAVNRTHDIVDDSSKFQLEILGGAWQATQIKFMDNILPAIKTGAEELTNYLSGKSNGNAFDNFRQSVWDSADNFRNEGHGTTASIIESIGEGIIGGIQIGTTTPKIFKQIGKAINDNLINGDWGNSLLTFPMHLVENGIGFINDLLKANKEFNKVVKQLPENLQDPAKLIEGLAKGGLILLMSGAIVKAIELSIRAASTTLKAGKTGIDITKLVIDLLTGNKGKGKGKGILDDLVGKTINANVVNVYGKVVNDGGDGDVIGGGKKSNKTGRKGGKGAPIFGWGSTSVLTNPLTYAALGATGYTALAGWGWSKWDGSYGGTDAAALRGEVKKGVPEEVIVKNLEDISKSTSNKLSKEDLNNLGSFIVNNQKLNTFDRGLKEGKLNLNPVQPQNAAMALNPELKNLVQQTQSTTSNLVEQQNAVNNSIVGGFNTANERLQNIKLQNQVSVNVAPPQVSITGNIKDHIQVQSSSGSNFTTTQSNKNETAWERMQKIMGRRMGW